MPLANLLFFLNKGYTRCKLQFGIQGIQIKFDNIFFGVQITIV